MKKLIATIALGTLLVVGFSLTNDYEPSELSMDREPSVLSISNTGSFF